MSAADANAAIDRMESDEAFAERVRDAGGRDSSLAILKEEGFDVTPQEMRDAALDRYGEQLSTEQLDALAAGKQMSEGEGAIMGWGILVAGAAAGAAAI